MHHEQYENGRKTNNQSKVPGWGAIATATAIGAAGLAILYARRFGARADRSEVGLHWSDEQAITVVAPLEKAETAWVEWCASGNAKLGNNYAVRFEPAPGAQGTEVHVSGGGSKGTIRQELRRFKQFLETGEITVSDGPGLWRPAQPTGAPKKTKRSAGVL